MTKAGAGRRLLRALLPLHSRRRLFAERFVRQPLREPGARARGTTDADGRPAILFLAHASPGGVLHTSRDLIARLAGSYDCYLLLGDLYKLELYRYVAAAEDEGAPRVEPRLVRRFWRTMPWSAARPRSSFDRQVYETVLATVPVELVHVRHLLGHAFDVLDLCREREVPVVLSFHDFYLACPSVHLLDERLEFCGGVCTAPRARCSLLLPWLDDLPVLKGEFLERWRETVRAVLPGIAAFVVTSSGSRDLLGSVYPELRSRLRVIEHGRDLAGLPDTEAAASLAHPPQPGQPLRLLLPGHLGPHKGSRYMAELARLDARERGVLELHFLGTVPAELAGYGRHHGAYDRGEFARYVAAIRPALGGLFSIWAETYSHTLTECWAAGLPVLATDLGAPAERIRQHGGGWLVSPADPRDAYARLLAVLDDPEEYARRRAEAVRYRPRTETAMAADYAELYRELVESVSS